MKRVCFLLYDGFTASDVSICADILGRIENIELLFAAKWKGEVLCDVKPMKMFSTHHINEVKNVDILIVPGSSVTFLEVVQDRDILNWINQIASKAKIIASVSSGSIILASAGMLEGKKATSHWYSTRFLAEYNVEISKERLVEDGKFITAAGTTAAIDLSIFIIEKLVGAEMAKAITLMIEYSPEPKYPCGKPEKAPKETLILTKKILKENALRSGIFTFI
jgi:transcriptional regulator GlxA family with amidase domain